MDSFPTALSLTGVLTAALLFYVFPLCVCPPVCLCLSVMVGQCIITAPVCCSGRVSGWMWLCFLVRQEKNTYNLPFNRLRNPYSDVCHGFFIHFF